VKRSGPLKRSTPLARGTSQLARTPFVDHKAAARRSAQSSFRASVLARVGGHQARCEGCCVILAAGVERPPVSSAAHRGEHAHHVLSKARGGTDDPSNGLWLCTASHGWAHGHPEVAEALGLLRRST
jgi:hypothetical protein